MRALVTGVTGQDGAYLSRLLLDKGYEVYGGYRRTSTGSLARLEHLGVDSDKKFHLIELDVTDPVSCVKATKTAWPGEVYNLAAQSFVGASFNQPRTTLEVNGLGCVNMLESFRNDIKPLPRFYQASTSEMFGNANISPQNEDTPFRPRSPYGAAKLYAHNMTVHYREAYELHASCGILFNHESPLRGDEFVTQKIAKAAGGSLKIGNLNAHRDWGYAGDYVEGMWRMLQQDEPDDYILATGRTATVRDFISQAYWLVDKPLTWKGRDEHEVGMHDGEVLVSVDPEYYRPTDVNHLLGDASKAKKQLGWEATTTWEEVCESMTCL